VSLLLLDKSHSTSKRQVSGEVTEASLQAYLDLAEAVYQLGNVDQAAEMLERAAEVAHDLPEDDPRLAQTLNKLGVVRGRQGRHAEAERLLKRAVGIAERSAILSSPELPSYLYNLAAVYRLSGRKQQARAL